MTAIKYLSITMPQGSLFVSLSLISISNSLFLYPMLSETRHFQCSITTNAQLGLVNAKYWDFLDVFGGRMN